MNLPRVTDGMDLQALKRAMILAFELIEQADRRNFKRGDNMDAGAVILTSPDGTRWAVTVDDAGDLSAVPA